MKLAWDISSPIWYPLVEVDRKDVITFDISDDPSSLKEITGIVKDVLSSIGVQSVFQLGEKELGVTPYKMILQELKISIQHLNEDTFWCDETLKWVIYGCHDGYVTIGGNQVINEMKRVWDNL
jgi:uncharacterized protein YlxP (DUF503 family)